MALNQKGQAALRRLTQDLKEIQNFPIANVSALPLEDNMFEWHCNFRGAEGTEWAGAVFHVVLYFSEDYPAKSPSAEFLPSFRFSGGATKQGKKGTQVCLSIFSDFAEYHSEWGNEKGTGWSPSYTTQTVLLNLISFLLETSSGGYYSYGQSSVSENVRNAQGFSCKDCGHSHAKPYPPLPENFAKAAPAPNLALESLTCYVTKANFETAEEDIFGFGIAKTGNNHNPSLTSPCEFMTLAGFNMLSTSGRVESVMREELRYFLPQFISPAHGKKIKPTFEKKIAEISGRNFTPKAILDVLPKLLNSTVVTFMNGTTHTSERALHGYFSFHRLFLWAVSEYPTLAGEIRDRLTAFIKQANSRSKKVTPNVGEWLALLTVADGITWTDGAQAYLEENFDRNVMWYLKEKPTLANTKDANVNAGRLADTFRLTKVSRDLLAFQVLFLDIARPAGMSIEKVVERYDQNYGMPTADMEKEMKVAVQKIKAIKGYPEWFEVIKIKYPGDEKFGQILASSVDRAQTKDGYFYSNAGGNRGGRGGYNGRGR